MGDHRGTLFLTTSYAEESKGQRVIRSHEKLVPTEYSASQCHRHYLVHFFKGHYFNQKRELKESPQHDSIKRHPVVPARVFHASLLDHLVPAAVLWLWGMG